MMYSNKCENDERKREKHTIPGVVTLFFFIIAIVVIPGAAAKKKM